MVSSSKRIPIQSSHNTSPSKPYDISKHFPYSKLSSHIKSSAIFTLIEPQFFHQTIKISHWQEAMANEISALEKIKTRVLTKLPTGKAIIDANGYIVLNKNLMGLLKDTKDAKGYK